MPQPEKFGSQLLDSNGNTNTCASFFLEVWIQAVVVMVPTDTIPAAASVIQDGKAQIVQRPPALMTAMTTADVWMGNVCAIEATQEMTAASRHVQTTAMTRDTVWMENAFASRTSLVRTAASRSALMTALITASVWMAGASVMKAFMGTTVHQVSYW